MKKSTNKLIAHIEKGLTQTEIVKKGFPLSTVRYHFRRIKNPKMHEKLLKRHNKARREKYLESKELIHR
jgi:hypothetical protein